MKIAVIGGGPAGLRAAEVAATAGAHVTLFDAKPSVGRKFLVAGHGGLNLTHAEDPAAFAARYTGPNTPSATWSSLLADFDAEAVRTWAEGLGVTTFAASTGRVYPEGMKAAPLLRRWVKRLRELGVRFELHHRWTSLESGSPIRLGFVHHDEPCAFEAEAVVLALGGASWPDTGSDGRWPELLRPHGITITPWQAANCGWEVVWPAALLTEAEGKPLKNIAASAGGQTALGELTITRYGLEGGPIYQLGAALRAMPSPRLTLDLKPHLSAAQLVERFKPSRLRLILEAQRQWRLSDPAVPLLDHHPARASFTTIESLAAAVKALPIELGAPRPLAEAISSAGGVAWPELDDNLMLRKLPGVFVAGEMIDWEAPTGGYLLQGCFATGTRAGIGALQYVQ